MPEFLLDTNIVSYYLKQPASGLALKINSVPARKLCISVITEAELLFGLRGMPPEARMQKLVPAFLADIQVRSWNSSCAVRYAELAAEQRKTGMTLSLFDLMIAAHALAKDLTLISHDTVFRQVGGLKLEDWVDA